MTFPLIPIIWFIDQKTKKHAVEHYRNAPREYRVKDKVSLSYVENRGAFLGLLKNKPLVLHILTLLSILLIVLIAVPYWFLGKSKMTGLGYAMIVAGAIGNYTDRIRDGYVTDFIAFAPKHKVHFNIADFSIFIGAFIVLVKELFFL